MDFLKVLKRKWNKGADLVDIKEVEREIKVLLLKAVADRLIKKLVSPSDLDSLKYVPPSVGEEFIEKACKSLKIEHSKLMYSYGYSCYGWAS